DKVAICASATIRPLAGTRDSLVSLFSPEGKRLWRAQLADDVTSVAVNSNGARVAAGSLDGKVSLINGTNGDVLWQTDLPKAVRCSSRERNNCIEVDINAEIGGLAGGTGDGEVDLTESVYW